MSTRKKTQTDNQPNQSNSTAENTTATATSTAQESLMSEAFRLMKQHHLEAIFATSDGYFFTKKEYAQEHAEKNNFEVWTYTMPDDNT
ncbi:hypothetical protein [Thermaurantimonas aggregans]|uniref:hypothetical protein n=1 Tax=Thermaurantimonas aggregans TaxID=2173829 RepID=UPI0023F05519|nr:hypothetical protein [Thermaurantimonas aggregans]MCX8149218.1 hypothetical protein [Thermaurantimonas aggregans]